MDFRHPYLTGQLIAYIGNKRALLPFLARAFSELADGRKGLVFSDPFAGSGAVSRLARLMGFSVLCNDWEPYCLAINSCYLRVSASEALHLFPGKGIDAVLAELNCLPSPRPESRYISRHYAPRSTGSADWRTERLFYTAENAAVIDAVRTRIEELYPGTPARERERKEKALLLGPLLYEASTHTNTSGVFKACHKGFGGHGRDALGRIMAPIRLPRPILVDSPFPSRVFCMDAARFAGAHGADICYLDPPYATHQYGSNYFMLTSIALWDKPEVSEERGADGRLRKKAGIRPDWVRTRSPFCSRSTAAEAFRRMADAADCRWLCMSYSDEGLLSPEEVADILAETGSLSVRTTGYVKYPGGKQSITRTTGNVELLFVADRRGRHGRAAAGCVQGALLDARLAKLFRSAFHPERIRAAFPAEGAHVLFPRPRGRPLALPMKGFHRFLGDPQQASGLPAGEKSRLVGLLEGCVVTDRREEIGVLLDLLENGCAEGDRTPLLRELLRLLRKLAHRKHRAAFEETLARVQAFAAGGADGGAPQAAVPSSFLRGLAQVEAAARKRFEAAR
jgi:adenine-specific DNA-methyltransferase